MTDPEVLEDCILDLAVTGEEAFAEAAAVEEDVAFPETPWTVVTASSTSSGAPSRWRRRPTARCTSARRRHRPTTGQPGQYVVAHLGADGAQGR